MALEWSREYLSKAPPRQILRAVLDSPLLLFTDGASEADGVTVGAVLLEEGFAPEAFGVVVPDSVVAAWMGSWQLAGYRPGGACTGGACGKALVLKDCR